MVEKDGEATPRLINVSVCCLVCLVLIKDSSKKQKDVKSLSGSKKLWGGGLFSARRGLTTCELAWKVLHAP